MLRYSSYEFKRDETSHKKNWWSINRLIALMLSLALLVVLVPVTAFAQIGEIGCNHGNEFHQDTAWAESSSTDAKDAQGESQDQISHPESLNDNSQAICGGMTSYANNQITNENDNIDYLCFTAQKAGSKVTLNAIGSPTQGQAFQTSTDKSTWTDYAIGTEITLANADDSVYWRAKDGGNSTVGESDTTYYQFSTTVDHNGKITVSGSIMTLLDQADTMRTLADKPYCFYSLFADCTAISSAPILPATTLSSHCYHRLFYHCPKLATAPSLPATELAEHCYHSMFFMCDAVEVAPDLPATTLPEGCYEAMFKRCAGLTTMPLMGNGNGIDFTQHACCKNMFVDCANLVVYSTGSDLKLKCTSVADPDEHTTMNMFLGCSSVGDYCTDKVKTPTSAFSCYTKNEVTYCNITFQGSGGTTESGDASYTQKAVQGATVALTSNLFSRDSYTFEGWSKTSGSSTVDYINEQEVEVTGEMTLYAVWTQDKVEPQVSDLTFNSPASLVYDGQAKTASFTGKEGMGAITVMYAEELEGPWVSDAPMNVGTYYVMASVAEGSGYVAKNLISESWKFTISKAKIDVPAALTGLTYNGEEQTGVLQLVGAKYILSNNKGTNADSYTAVASLNDKINYEWNLEIPTSDDQNIDWTIAKRSVILTSDSASKEYDGTALSAKNVLVSGAGFVESEKSQITYSNFTELTDIGVASNSFDVNWGSVNKDNYDITVIFGTLEVTSASGSDIKIDPASMKAVQEELEAKYPGQKVSVNMQVSQDHISSKDIEKIQAAAPNKKLQSYDATLVVKHNETTETVKEVNTPISIQYKFDFDNKSDFQCFRVHNEGDAEELLADSSKTEHVVYDQPAGTVTVTANKYSTYSIAYLDASTPSPESTPSSDAATESTYTNSSSTGDMSFCILFAIGITVIAAAGFVVYIRRKLL